MNDPRAPAEEGPLRRDGALARVPGTIFSPVTTFQSIARRPTWLPPLLLSMAVSLAVTAILLPRIDWDHMIRAQLERGGQTVPEDRVQRIVERQKSFAPVLYNVIGGASPAFVCLLVALVFLGAFKAFGWDLSFARSFGVAAHAFLPAALGSLIFIPVLVKQQSVDPRTIGDLLMSNPGFLIERKSSPALHSILQSLDLFAAWTAALLVIGYAASARVPRKQAAGVVITLWGAYVLAKAGFAALFG